MFDEDALKTASTRRRKAFFLCNPQNPGGTVFRRAELERLAELTRDLLIVSDEIHCDLVLEPDLRHVPIASLAPEVSRRTVTLMSPNKTFNFPAAGCAWAIIEDPGLRRKFSGEVDAHVLPSPSVFGYVAALAALRATATTGSRRSSTTCAATATWSRKASACRWPTSRRPTSRGSTAPAWTNARRSCS